MLTKPVPLWIMAGGLLLAGAAGCVNAVGFLGAHHQAISHLSGTVTLLGIELARGDGALALHAAATLGCFFGGCVLSGLIIRQSTLKAGRRYGVALAGEAALLAAAAYFLRHGAVAGDYLAAMACGLQNAMATSYSGAVIRTTHMTGIITDLGIMLGLVARGERIDWRRTRLYLVLLSGFFLGGVLGCYGYGAIGYDTLLVPAAVCGATGTGYALFKHFTRPAA
ncbi:MAG: DUF1275 domain-containing protein [Opitutaceae bacterium]|nr:DUF1275 domain-containing protein [Opitutaceae bacterium]